MLKSTHRPAGQVPVEEPLPPGWTEHKAPSGHTYYYNAETKQSTYTRPTIPSDEPLQIDYGATEPDQVMRASLQVMEEFQKNNTQGAGHFTGGRSYHDHSRRRGNQGDRPKSKAAIPDCAPWLLVKTKLGRRFVHNTETKQSLWKFPQDVMMAVIEMDRLEWEAKKKVESEPETKKPEEVQTVTNAPQRTTSPDHQPQPRHDDYDSDSYEEVEVTDDEGEEGEPKRPRLDESPPPPSGPVELGEDDIAWQLAQMEEDYEQGEDPAHQYDQGEDEDEEAGLPLTTTDNIALFRSLLDDSGISPYATFEKLIEDIHVVEDERYIALPNTTTRKEAFVAWSKDRINELQQRKKAVEQTQKPRDVKVEYLRFLHRHATPKLYWPEFKRKFKKESDMRDVTLQDKDREKLYRELVAKLKTGESDRRKELVTLLKSMDKGALTKDMAVEDLPDAVLRDVRFYTIEKDRRDELVRTFLETQR
ncbi:hypothetical protein EDD36DRAFT_443939 [Exophiala viscosa]|uniref:WW domain-containing protein n=1 Tax=Exophiala viscosa TaxID=2486360 RepID=A0AAN6IC85_9EURO|nr:hypothetical protein EDD36DRAFT_443939 [Exophiala viscosa]